jgi:Ca2+-binding RTX toxin-like protein
MEGKTMSQKSLWLVSGILAVGFVVLATPASAINTCATNCNCTVSCATSCLWAGFEGTGEFKEWVIYAENCGEYGLCAGQGSCVTSPPGCPAQACTTTWNGGSGNDTYNGGSARECLNGNAGNDTIDGNAGDDTINGNDGTDTLYGDSGNDCLYGGPLNDYLDGESGYDLANGQGGSGDTCYAELISSCP